MHEWRYLQRHDQRICLHLSHGLHRSVPALSVCSVMNCVSHVHQSGTEVCLICVLQAQTARPISMNVPPTRAWTRGPALMTLLGTNATVSFLTQVWKCWWNCWKYFTYLWLSLTQMNDVGRIKKKCPARFIVRLPQDSKSLQLYPCAICVITELENISIPSCILFDKNKYGGMSWGKLSPMC